MPRRIRHLYRFVGVSLVVVVQFSCQLDYAGPGTTDGNRCQVTATPYILGDNTAGALTTSDCRLADGSYIDYYGTTLPAGGYVFNQSSTEFDTYLFLLTADRLLIGLDDNDPQGSTNSAIKALLPAGDFILGANAYPGSTGAYNLSSTASTTDATSCEDVYVVKGTSTTQNLQTSDCSASMSYADHYIIAVRAGQSITITMSSAAFDSFVELYDSSGRVAFNDKISTTSRYAQLTYNAPLSDFYFISAQSAGGIATGAYTLSVQ